jgi:hypothetical protein
MAHNSRTDVARPQNACHTPENTSGKVPSDHGHRGRSPEDEDMYPGPNQKDDRQELFHCSLSLSVNGRTVSTGQRARQTILCATDPKWLANRAEAPAPCAPMTIRSEAVSSAVFKMTSAGREIDSQRNQFAQAHPGHLRIDIRRLWETFECMHQS